LKNKEKWAKEYVDSIRKMARRPGLTDVWLAGFEMAREKLAEELNENKDVNMNFIENFGDADAESSPA
jgi:hypothetical protein